MRSTSKFVRPINRFEQDFGKASQDDQRQIISILQRFMVEIRGLLAMALQRTKLITPAMEGQCHTCAFNPATDTFAGFPATAYGLLWSFIHDKDFCCYGDNPDWKDQHLIDEENPLLCRGFGSVRLYCGTRATFVAHRALRNIRNIVPEKS